METENAPSRRIACVLAGLIFGDLADDYRLFAGGDLVFASHDDGRTKVLPHNRSHTRAFIETLREVKTFTVDRDHPDEAGGVEGSDF
ncbi:MAG: hypothetical protein ABEL76_13335 [Bradymonadaceae bacterium]